MVNHISAPAVRKVYRKDIEQQRTTSGAKGIWYKIGFPKVSNKKHVLKLTLMGFACDTRHERNVSGVASETRPTK
ncbi:MAG: hypothetical protein OXM61_05040 [Candidatus Poribacteria bacterium]|nr:hypothetical protein [Candidatus Poribacteria bacterium]